MDFAEKFLTSITPTVGDPTFSILKSHLVFEEMLRDYLNTKLPRPDELEGARLTFAQLLAIARASTKSFGKEEWVWTAISKLNKLRNLLAHNLKPVDLSQQADEFVEFVVKGLEKPLPEPTRRAQRNEQAIHYEGPMYTKFDIATIGLYGWCNALLGLDTSV